MAEPLLAPPIEATPQQYERSYRSLDRYIANSLDYYKSELSAILFPYFGYIFCTLIKHGHPEAAHLFFNAHKTEHLTSHGSTLVGLQAMYTPQHLLDSDLGHRFLAHRHELVVHKFALELLLSHLYSHRLVLVIRFLNDHISVKKVDRISYLRFADESENSTILWGVKDNSESFIDPSTVTDHSDKAKKRRADGSIVAVDDSYTQQQGPPPAHPLSSVPPTHAELATVNADLYNRFDVSSSSLPSIMNFSLFSSSKPCCLNFMADGSAVACGSDDSVVTVFDVASLSRIQSESQQNGENLGSNISLKSMSDVTIRLIGHSDPVTDVCFVPRAPERTLLSSSLGGEVRYWLCPMSGAVSGIPETPKPRSIAVYPCHSAPIYSLSPFQQGTWFLTGSHDKSAKLWFLERLEPVRVFTGHLGPVRTVVAHPNAAYVATGGADKFIRIFDIRSAKCMVKIPVLGYSEPCSLCFSDNGRLLAISTVNGDVFLWDLAQRQYVGYTRGHDGPVNSLSFSKGSGTILATGGSDSTVKLWSIDELKPLKEGQLQSDLIDWGVDLISSYPVKYSMFSRVGFTARNLLLTASIFDSDLANEIVDIT
ncbi:hypothetical protein RCL1_000692 [Eukaryota sp. TZLM3-RCL]